MVRNNYIFNMSPETHQSTRYSVRNSQSRSRFRKLRLPYLRKSIMKRQSVYIKGAHYLSL